MSGLPAGRPTTPWKLVLEGRSGDEQWVSSLDESNTCHWAFAILAGMGLETSLARTVCSRRGGAQGSRSRLRLMVPTAHPKPQAQTFSCSAGCSTSVSHPWRQAQPLRRFSCRRLAPTVVGAALSRAGRPAAGCIVLCTMGWHALQHGPIIGALGREAWRLMNEFVISAFPPRFGMPPGALRTRLKKPLTLSSREHRSSRETQTTL